MNRRLLSLLAAPALLLSTAAIAQPEYVTIAMETVSYTHLTLPTICSV